VREESPALLYTFQRDALVLKLQIAFAEGAGVSIPLKMGAKIRPFGAGAGQYSANTTVVLAWIPLMRKKAIPFRRMAFSR
jgi:hypothetical protein